MIEIILINPGESVKTDLSDDVALTEFGVSETIKLAAIIAILISSNVAIFSSTEGDATESAAIIGKTLGVEPENLDYCCQEDINNDDIAMIMELISKYETEKYTLIFIISCPFLLKILQQIIRQYQNIDTDIGEIKANYALFISFEGDLPLSIGPDDDIYAED